MSRVAQWNPEAKRYSNLSGITFGFAIIAPIISWVAFQTNIETIQAIGVLIIPFALFCWIFTTIRALHKRTIRFWFIPSTYVALASQAIALGIVCIQLILIALVGQHSTTAIGTAINEATTLYWAALIAIGGATLWCLYYNIKKTETLILGVCLTILQTISAAGIVGVWFIWSPNRKEPEHIDAVTGIRRP
jgi:hypothetical protein